MKLRLDRFLCQARGVTRSQAQRAIRAAEVSVNDAALTDPGAHVGPRDRIRWNGEPLSIASARYFMLNKPAGVVCATRDRGHRTVLDLLRVPNTAGLHVAGRLDIDATGLVLITDDGDWSHRVTAPRFKQPKVYRVLLAAPIDATAVTALERGVQLRDEPKRCAPVGVERLAADALRLVLTEGKYHQVKRMLAAVGNRVVGLHRERIGTIVLDPALGFGAYRALTPDEIAVFARPNPEA